VVADVLTVVVVVVVVILAVMAHVFGGGGSSVDGNCGGVGGSGSGKADFSGGIIVMAVWLR
jgi:hypothetical protein